MVKTNTGLVDYVQKAFNDGWGYVYGTIGQLCTASLLDDCARRCTEFDEDLWNATVDCLIIHSAKEFTFRFKDETELPWKTA